MDTITLVGILNLLAVLILAKSVERYVKRKRGERKLLELAERMGHLLPDGDLSYLDEERVRNILRSLDTAEIFSVATAQMEWEDFEKVTNELLELFRRNRDKIDALLAGTLLGFIVLLSITREERDKSREIRF